jgi:hypothetical protein
MDGQTEAPGAMPTASWLAEQEAKQAGATHEIPLAGELPNQG